MHCTIQGIRKSRLLHHFDVWKTVNKFDVWKKIIWDIVSVKKHAIYFVWNNPWHFVLSGTMLSVTLWLEKCCLEQNNFNSRTHCLEENVWNKIVSLNIRLLVSNLTLNGQIMVQRLPNVKPYAQVVNGNWSKHKSVHKHEWKWYVYSQCSYILCG